MFRCHPLTTANNIINGITGTWAPALNNTATTTYTFTPAAGQCANTATMTITVNAKTDPTFTQVPAICTGDNPVCPANNFYQRHSRNMGTGAE